MSAQAMHIRNTSPDFRFGARTAEIVRGEIEKCRRTRHRFWRHVIVLVEFVTAIVTAAEEQALLDLRLGSRKSTDLPYLSAFCLFAGY